MIFVSKNTVSLIRSGRNQSCLKIIYKDFEISVASDDSCGCMEHLSRTDIRVYKGDEDVTSQFFDGIPRDAEDLHQIMNKIDEIKG